MVLIDDVTPETPRDRKLGVLILACTQALGGTTIRRRSIGQRATVALRENSNSDWLRA
jgi:uncharacterized membrane protein YeiH